MRQEFALRFRKKVLQLGKRTLLMGVLNVTPDSFSDGGRFLDAADAIDHGLQLVEIGADILDIGGQSTRPGSESIGSDEELRRIVPVLRGIRRQSDCLISIDTYRADVARECLNEGADMINDVSSFRMDRRLASVVAEYRVPVVCMHFLKSIHPMPADPHYDDLFGDILQFFRETFDIAESAGISHDQIIVDPGIGFGKSLEHNLKIMQQLHFLDVLNAPVLAGPSRKSFIGKITGDALPTERLAGTAAAAGVCVLQGAHILRVHDVHFFKKFCLTLDAIVNA